MQSPQIIILDLGSQYTQIIARELLVLGYQNRIIKPSEISSYLLSPELKGVILSGGSASVYEDGAPEISESIFSSGLPVLGICYGMQYMVYRSDKTLVKGSDQNKKEYGPTEITLSQSKLFQNIEKNLVVWASHGDSVLGVPKEYKQIATSGNVIEAIEHETKPWYGVQFHPEVFETKDDNQILRNFAETICGCEKDWNTDDVIPMIQNEVLDAVSEGKALLGVSGGVDSTTLAGLLTPVLKEKLLCVFIDTGGMREGEVERVIALTKEAGIDLRVVNAHQEFFSALENITDAEEKRARFKETYQKVFKKIINEEKITHILQGTLATDLIESGAHGNSALIKSHHNVGLSFGVTELQPFKNLFKHEVRHIARTIGLGAVLSERQPFPGPGLFIRVVGTLVTEETIGRVRRADHIVGEILKETGWDKKVSQTIVALLGVKTVGVKGDGRSYEYPIVVRAVATTDFMTVTGVEFPSEIKKRIISEITREKVNRVFFDETPKPPATTEFE